MATIPFDAALQIATANGWTYNEATEVYFAVLRQGNRQYIADLDDANAYRDVATVLQQVLGIEVEIGEPNG